MVEDVSKEGAAESVVWLGGQSRASLDAFISGTRCQAVVWMSGSSLPPLMLSERPERAGEYVGTVMNCTTIIDARTQG